MFDFKEVFTASMILFAVIDIIGATPIVISLKEKVGKIFEPYFTNKNKGTGLGLSIVKKIIEDHNGKIKIDKNKQMAGTTSLIIFENTNA